MREDQNEVKEIKNQIVILEVTGVFNFVCLAAAIYPCFFMQHLPLLFPLTVAMQVIFGLDSIIEILDWHSFLVLLQDYRSGKLNTLSCSPKR